MTIEEAIHHLENARKYPVAYTDKEQEAYEMAFSALRAQQTPVKLDRSQRKGCEFCIGDFDGYTPRFRDVNGKSRPLFIPEGKAMIVLNGRYNRDYDIPIKYCPFCGRPLTEEAWAELERRLTENEP